MKLEKFIRYTCALLLLVAAAAKLTAAPWKLTAVDPVLPLPAAVTHLSAAMCELTLGCLLFMGLGKQKLNYQMLFVLANCFLTYHWAITSTPRQTCSCLGNANFAFLHLTADQVALGMSVYFLLGSSVALYRMAASTVPIEAELAEKASPKTPSAQVEF